VSAGTKRRNPTWQQALFLLIFGVIVGYPSCMAVGRGVWGAGSSQYQGFYVACFFAAVVAFLAGFASFIIIAIKALVSPAEVAPGLAAKPSSSVPISRVTRPDPFPNTIAQLQTPILSAHVRAALVRLRIVLIAVVALAFTSLPFVGNHALTTRYGRYLLLNATLTFLLSELPYVVALIRTWNLPDRAGLALAMAAGSVQILASWFFTDLRYRADLPPPSGWLSGSLGLLVVVLAYLSWRTSPTRKQDVGLLISVVFGMVAYTVLAQIGLSILIYRERLWQPM
jgi:hypothetical protein